MIAKKNAIWRLKKAIFGCFFGILALFGMVAPLINSGMAYAEPANTQIPTVITPAETTETPVETPVETPTETTESPETTETEEPQQQTVVSESIKRNAPGSSCEDSLDKLGWFVCPETNKVAEAVDWLHTKMKDLLVVNPVEIEDGKPVYEIWKYFRGVTNVVFIIFLLVVIWSQVTGVGISNYGIKKVLPKLIVVVVLINLSIYVCAGAVDISNILGQSLRGMLESIQYATMGGMEVSEQAITSLSEIYASLAGGVALAIAGTVIAFETGVIWLLIPVVLGAFAAIASGLITIALRQAAIVLLIIISPLAIVAYLLPNTEVWFKKWKQLFTRMLVFYPMFSLLYGASSLAGWTIIASAKDGFWLILGYAVQVFPLIASWKLMSMSGTFLGTINGKLQSLMSRPVAANRAWAESHRQHSLQKHLSTSAAYTPSLRLMQFLSDRKIARDEETKEHAEAVKLRGLAYGAKRNYDKNGVPNRDGIDSYDLQARKALYQSTINRHTDNMNKGLGTLETVKAHASRATKAELDELDVANVDAFDMLKMEAARGAKIEYDNARGFYNRAMNAENAIADIEALKAGKALTHEFHGVLQNPSNIMRYETMKKVMEGKDLDVSFITADAAHGFSAQSQIVRNKFNDLFTYNAPTQDVVNMLERYTKDLNAGSYIDPIIAGFRTLNVRGDTDLLRKEVSNLLNDKKVELGTNVSQALANFCMFDVKGNDPFLRRLGKYMNLETARIFNEGDPAGRRTRKYVTMDEYVNGEFDDEDEDGNIIYNPDGTAKKYKSKRKAAVLLKGTSYKDIERTAFTSMNEGILEASYDTDASGNRVFNYEKFKRNQEEIWNSIMPNVIGDQFSFLSGSEQVLAFAKGVTGVDSEKHAFDWKGFFGEDVAKNLTDEQKKDFVKMMHKRTSDFLGGHVPIQIAKTKSDVLEAVKNQYTLYEALMGENQPEGENGVRDDILNVGKKMDSASYGALEQAHLKEAKKAFVDSFKKDALKGFATMYHKGYQGEAKDGLVQWLDPETIYKMYHKDEKNNTNTDDEEEDDGPLMDGGDIAGGSVPFSVTKSNIDDLFAGYNNGESGRDVAGFWDEVKHIISNSPESGGSLIIDEVENQLPQYHDVASLYVDIINRFFGGFGD